MGTIVQKRWTFAAFLVDAILDEVGGGHDQQEVESELDLVLHDGEHDSGEADEHAVVLR